MKVKKITGSSESEESRIFICPACKTAHSIVVKSKSPRAAWQYNWNDDNPTFKPSLLVQWDRNRCHSYITDGKIQFLNDCTHDLAGQTVDLTDIKN